MVRQRQSGKSSKDYPRRHNFNLANRKISSQDNHSFLSRYATLIGILVLIYLSPLILFCVIPSLQAQIVFMPVVSWPPFMNLSDPSSIGLKATKNFYIESENSIKLGVWHVLPKSLRDKPNLSNEDFDKALLEKPVFLYVHGNAGTRGGYHRVELYKILSEIDANVIAFDYRGFGDSTNERPTAKGLVADTKLVYQWIKQRISPKNKLYVWGHSMGTAVASRFVAELTDEGEKPTGVILESGFNTVKLGILNYPLAKIYNYLPIFEPILDHVIKTQDLDFISEERVKKIRSPLLMLHAEDDRTVKIKLGRLLRDAARISRSHDDYFKYIEFEEKFHYGHKYICTEPSLPTIIRDFMNVASSSK